MSPVIDLEKCTGCGICEDICPGDIIHPDEHKGKVIVLYPDECWYCGSCRDECPEEAISYSFPDVVLRAC